MTRDSVRIGDGQTINFTADVSNTDGGTLRNFGVRFAIDGSSIGDVPVAGGLSAGSTTQVSKSWTATPGQHTLTVTADQSTDVTELREDNNTLSEQLPLVASSDLQVTAIDLAPAGVQDGQSATITATISNTATGDVGRDFQVRFEVDGAFIGRQQVSGGVGASQSVQVSQTWTAEAGTHTVRVVADEANEVFESQEGNNVEEGPLPAVPFSDLTVSAIDWTPNTFGDGQDVTLSATISNVGQGDTARSFTVRFEIDAQAIGTQVVSGGLADGAPVEVTQAWLATAGEHEVAMAVDVNNDVPEATDANNRDQRNLPNVPFPDLAVGSIDFDPATFEDGDPVDLTATVSNIGAGDTSRAFVVRFYVDDASIGTELVPGGLPSGTSTRVTHPWTAFPGQHAVKAVADSTGVVPEPAEGNNTLEAPLPAVQQADLIVTDVALGPTVQSNGTPTAGQTVMLQATVENTGTGGTSRAFEVDFRIDGSRVGRAEVRDGLGVGASTVISTPWKTTPGDHVLNAVADATGRVDESDENNNSEQAQLPAIGAPDLVVTNIIAPTEAVSGQQVDLSWTLKNEGTRDASGTWIDQVFLSTDDQPGGDQFFGAFRFTGTIAVGQSVVRSQSISLPLLLSGDRFVVIRTDASRELVEAVENNNTTVHDVPIAVALSPFPNLQVSQVTAPPSAFSQQSTLVEWTVTNEGTGATGAATWSDGVWLSLDETLDFLDTFLGSAANASFLDAGASYNGGLTVTLPRGLEGPFYFIVRTDTFNRVFEHQAEDDNVTAGGPTQVDVPPLPDLQVSSVSAPGSAFSGQPMSLNWRVSNDGDAGTGVSRWRDSVFMSDDDVLDGGDRSMGSLEHNGALAPGESYAASMSVSLPIAVTGDFFFFVVTDSSNQVFEHGLEGNNDNFDATPTTVILTPPPDLEVTLVDAPNTAVGSQPLTFTYIVENLGASVTPNSSWKDSFYLSADTLLDVGDRSLGTLNHFGALDVDESYSRSVSFTLATGLEGGFFVLVQTDRDDVVFEGVDIGPNVGFDPEAVDVCACPPDLVVSVVDAPDAALASHALTISYTVTNGGVAPTPSSSWHDAFYLSSDKVLDGTDLLLGRRRHDGALGVGASYNESGTFTLPDGLAGDFHAIVVTDTFSRVFEGDGEGNNAGFDDLPTTVESRPADLVVSAASAPSTAAAGNGILVEWTVANQGAGDTVATRWRDRVYASTDVLLGSDTLLGEFRRDGALDPEGTYSRSEVVTVPFSFQGQYHLFIVTDTHGDVFEGPNEGNNGSPALPLEVIQPEKFTADLQVTVVSAPTTTLSGVGMTVTWTVGNLGEGATNANFWHDEVYLSSDQVIDGADVRLGRVNRSGALDPAGEYDVSRVLDLPLDLTGTFFLIVRTDRFNRVLEGDQEGNNDGATAVATEITLSPVPDLVLGSVDGPFEGVGGQTIPISWSVSNQDQAPATGSWYDAFYLSRDQVFDKSTDIYLGFHNHEGGLDVGQTYAETQTFKLPSNISGAFFVFGVTDSGGRVYERGAEANNVAFDDLEMVVTEAPPADLVAGTITIPASGVPGQNTTVTYTVDNQGLNPALGNWTDSLYLSVDAEWELSDKLFGRVGHKGDVPAGGSYTHTVTAPVPGVTPGDYHLIVRSDILNRIPESVEENNVGASLDQASLDAAELLPNVPVTGHIENGQSIFYRIDVEAGETMVVTLDGADGASNELFVRYGEMPSRSQFDFGPSDAFAADQEVLVPFTRGGTYYVLVHNVAGGDSDYTIKARIVGFELLGVTPDFGSKKGEVTLALAGSRFSPAATATLVPGNGGPGTLQPPPAERPAKRTWWVESSEVWATFDLQGLATGAYDVRVDDDGQATTLADALTVTDGPLGEARISLGAPSGVRPGQQGVLTLDYHNSGETDVLAPVMDISAEGADLRLPEDTQFIQLLGINREGPAGILPPGARGRFSLVFNPTIGGGEIIFGVGEFEASDEFLDWDAIKDAARDPYIPLDAWDVIFGNFKDGVGTTQGEYVAVLAENATYLSQLGKHTADVNSLLAFELMQASNIISPHDMLASSRDAGAPTQGMALAFPRVYLQPLSSRFELGPLGRGWAHGWQIEAKLFDEGQIVIIKEQNLYRTFLLQPDGAYLGGSSDFASLTVDEDGVFRLRETSQVTLVFRPADGKLDYKEDPVGNQIRASYSAGRLTSLVHSNGAGFTLSYDANGRIGQLVDQVGNVTRYTYDAGGEHLVRVEAPFGVTEYQYDTQGGARQHALTKVTTAVGTSHSFEYDDLGRLVREYDEGGAHEVSYQYDDPGTVRSTNLHGATVTRLFDNSGQVIQFHDPIGRAFRFTFDTRNRPASIVGPTNLTDTFTFDDLGNLVGHVNPLGQSVEATYEPVFNQPLSITDQRGNVLQYSYDDRGNQTGTLFPDGSSEQLDWDSSGNMTEWTNRRGAPVTYTYNQRGQMTGRLYPDGSEKTYGYDAQDRLVATSDEGGVTTLAYDAADRLTRITYPTGRFLTFAYDVGGRRTRVEDHSGFAVNYEYNSVGQLATVTDAAGGPVAQYTYDDIGQLTRTDLGNGTFTTFEYDLSGTRNSTVHHAPDGSVISSFMYTYDVLDRPVKLVAPEGEWSYGYDALGQLTAVTLPTGRIIEYQYDALGNRVSVTDDGATTD